MFVEHYFASKLFSTVCAHTLADALAHDENPFSYAFSYARADALAEQ